MQENRKKRESLLYGVDETPPVYLLIPLAFQQFLTCFGSLFSYPFLIASAICLTNDDVGTSEIINTIVFVVGLSSILQSTFGVRLPIIQGASYAFITPVFVLMVKNKDKCPAFIETANGTLPFEPGSDQHRDIWQSNMNEINGSLMVASLIQIVIGFSGMIGLVIRFIGPLTIAPTISLIGLSLFETSSYKCATHWWIALGTVLLITLFSQYLGSIEIPFFGGTTLKIFSLFPVLMGIILMWIICLILTETGVFPDKKGDWGYLARTDIRSDVIENTAWFRFPYPGQWGTPKVTVAGVVGLFAAIMASMIESVGDYYACARMTGVSSPPGSAVSRGIGMEGITCLLAGAWGCGGGNTSYSGNIGAIGITKVGSRRVVQVAGLIMIILGCVGKFGALFVMLPDSIVGGIFLIIFGMVTAVGISNLQHVDLNSTRNLFIFGFAIFFGLSVPTWVAANPFSVGDDTADDVLNVLCGTNNMVGGLVAFILDNTIPGTLEERGMLLWRKRSDDSDGDWSTYEIPVIQKYLNKSKIVRFIPFCTGFLGDTRDKSTDENYLPSDQPTTGYQDKTKRNDSYLDHVTSSENGVDPSKLNGVENKGYTDDKNKIVTEF